MNLLPVDISFCRMECEVKCQQMRPVIHRLLNKTQWRQYLYDSERLLKSVAGDWIEKPEQYELAEHGYIVKTAQSGGASFHILSLY
ncbi:hypothetical protein F9044_24490, partial [Escherichia coli]